MPRFRRSSNEWFKAWDEIISLEDKLSRVKLSELSGASVQVIKSLQKDWMQQNVYVNYTGKHFKLFHIEDISLPKTESSLLTENKVTFRYIEQIMSHNEHFLSPLYL